MGNFCSTKKSPSKPSHKHPTKPSQPTTPETSPIQHIFVLIHGNNGFPAQMFHMRDALIKKFACVDVFVPQSNSKNTFHGVKKGAENIATEFVAHLQQQRDSGVTYATAPKFSVIAHSLGGLYARYFVRELAVAHQDVWQSLKPTSFLTCNSPHLGSKKPTGVDVISWIESTGADIYSNLIGETGNDLFLKNDLLLKMSEPESDFVAALKAFPYRTFLGVAEGDFVVPLPSAVCRKNMPYPRAPGIIRFTDPAINPNPMEIVAYSGFPEDYNAVFDSFAAKFKSTPAEAPVYEPVEEEWDMDQFNEVQFRPQMMVNMNAIGFRRIEVQFHVYHTRFVLNGSLHGMSLSIAGKLGDLPFMELSDKENSGPNSVNLLSEILRKDHGALESEFVVTKQD